MKNKRKKVAVIGASFLISAMIAGLLVAGLVFWQFSGSDQSFEKLGDKAFERGAYAEALHHWRRAKDLTEFAGRLYEKMGTAYLKLSNLDQAENLFRKALQASPGKLSIQMQVIRISLIRGDLGQAENLLSKLMETHGASPLVMVLSGDLSMLKGELAKGETAYKKAVALLPGQIRPRLKLAICLREQKKGFEAGRMVTRCREEGVTAPMDLMLLADYFILADDNARAESTMLRAINAAPENLEFRIRLCLYYRSLGMKEKAVTCLKSLVQDWPDNDEFKMQLADIYLSIQDMAGAEKLLDELKQRDMDSLGYNLLMGKYWLLKGRYSHAVSFLKTALEKTYSLVSAHYLLGVAYLAGSQTKLAEQAFIDALMLDPGYGESLLALAVLNYKNRHYMLASQYIDRFLGIDSSHADAWKVKGLSSMGEGNVAAALSAFTKAWYLGDISALIFLGQGFEASGKRKEALESYGDVIEKMPGMYEALFGYARLMVDAGQGSQVLAKIDRMAKVKKSSAVYYAGARISLELKEYDRCRAYLDQAMGQKPVSGAFYLLQAELFQATGNPQDAERVLIQCTVEHPRFQDGWLRLSSYYVERMNIDRAAEVLELALKSFPDHPQIMGNMAWLLLEKGDDLDRALDLARTAYDRMPEQAWLMDTLGWAYYHKKIYSQAEWMLAQAEELVSGSGMVQYHLGMAFYRQAKLSEARDKLEASLACDDLRAKDREAARKVLAGLNGKPDPEEQNPFDPDNESVLDPMKMPGMSDEVEDILQPDWSNLNPEM
ncbi:MAG: tetratricopeptide repeat protein [Desulfobacter sp.]|nr:MAG: tetratricopeptide repeat protein [Desulfobacter sp.]